MLGRVVVGAGALGAYAWRVEDPKGSYATFFDLSDWLTGLVLTGERMTTYLRNFVNLILIDQADGFLLGMAFFALLSLIFWPFKVAGKWGARKLGRGRPGRRGKDPKNLYFDEPRGGVVRTEVGRRRHSDARWR